MKTRHSTLNISVLSILFCLLLVLTSCSPPLPTGAPVIPAFQWPPPEPSASVNLSLGLLGEQAGRGVTLGDVDDRIIAALDAGGYDDRGYYSVPEGFAIVTRMEQIQFDGSSNPSPSRWVTEISPLRLWPIDFHDYAVALIGRPKGYYRSFVFIVTSRPVFPSNDRVTKETAVEWVTKGASSLPFFMARQEITKDFTCTVYIYQFEQTGFGEKGEQNIPSTITGRQHLLKANLLYYLEVWP